MVSDATLSQAHHPALWWTNLISCWTSTALQGLAGSCTVFIVVKFGLMRCGLTWVICSESVWICCFAMTQDDERLELVDNDEVIHSLRAL